MADYKKMYQIMLKASEQAIAEAKLLKAECIVQVLVAAELAAEDVYVQTEEDSEGKDKHIGEGELKDEN